MSSRKKLEFILKEVFLLTLVIQLLPFPSTKSPQYLTNGGKNFCISLLFYFTHTHTYIYIHNIYIYIYIYIYKLTKLGLQYSQVQVSRT